MNDDWLIWITMAIGLSVALLVYWAVASFIRAIARNEISRQLKHYIAGQVLRPRNGKGQFRK